MTDSPAPIEALRRAHWLLYSEGNEEYAAQIAVLIKALGYAVCPPRSY